MSTFIDTTDSEQYTRNDQMKNGIKSLERIASASKKQRDAIEQQYASMHSERESLLSQQREAGRKLEEVPHVAKKLESRLAELDYMLGKLKESIDNCDDVSSTHEKLKQEYREALRSDDIPEDLVERTQEANVKYMKNFKELEQEVKESADRLNQNAEELEEEKRKAEEKRKPSWWQKLIGWIVGFLFGFVIALIGAITLGVAIMAVAAVGGIITAVIEITKEKMEEKMDDDARSKLVDDSREAEAENDEDEAEIKKKEAKEKSKDRDEEKETKEEEKETTPRAGSDNSSSFIFLDFNSGRVVIELFKEDCPDMSKWFLEIAKRKDESELLFRMVAGRDWLLVTKPELDLNMSGDKRKWKDGRSEWGVQWSGPYQGGTLVRLSRSLSTCCYFGRVVQGADILNRMSEGLALINYGIAS